MLPGGLVADFGELADQLFKHQPHLHVADHLGVQVDLGELFCHLVEQPGLGQPLDLGVKFKMLKHVTHGGRERLHVAEQVLRNVVGVAQELFQVQRGGVVEALARLAQQEGLGVDALLFFVGQLGQHGGLGRFEHAVEAAQHGEGQDDLAVVGLLVVAAQQVGHGPDEGGEGLLVH